MKIIFLNVWNGIKSDELKEYITQQSKDTDVFCLQEVRGTAERLLKDILLYYTVISGDKYLADNEKFSQATYTRENINILSKETLLAGVSNIGLALYTQIQIKDKSVHICNVHGVCRPDDKQDDGRRLLQSRELIDRFSSLEGLKIIGGDFNLEYNTKSVRMFEENGYRNLIRDYKIPTTRNRYAWDRYPESKQYYSDYVFVNQSSKIKEFLVPDIEVSDHLPMILTIDL